MHNPMMAHSRWPQTDKGAGKIPSHHKPTAQQQQQPYYNPYNQHSTNKPPNYHKQSNTRKNPPNNNNNSSGPSSSSVSELPETFGLPSNSGLKTAITNKTASRNKGDIANEDISVISEPTKAVTDNTTIKIISPPTKSKPSDQDIEIIAEKSCFSKPNEDQVFKNYLLKAYGSGPVLISSKPQSNFTSNLTCIHQLMKKRGIEFYDSKIRRCHPYSSIKHKAILSVEEDDADSDGELEDGEDVRIELKFKLSFHLILRMRLKAKPGSKSGNVRSRKVIVIDDDNQFNSQSASDTLLHKPWITPELIKLIKSRNQLQEKLNETGETRGEAENEELLKKYRNIRNKVTKLVKKARKDYLSKYMSKEVKEKPSNSDADPKTSSVSLISTLTSTTTTTTTTAHLTVNNSESDVPKITTNNQTINEILASKSFASLGGSFLKDQTAIMNSLYTTYYNDYLKQYNKQQEELAKASADDKEGTAEYEKLQKQASVYAEQQRAIQKQLENTLKQAAEQLIQEIAEAATGRTSQLQNKPPQAVQQATSMNAQSSNVGLGSSQYQPVTHQGGYHLHHSIYPNPNMLMPMVVPGSTNQSVNQPSAQKIYYK